MVTAGIPQRDGDVGVGGGSAQGRFGSEHASGRHGPKDQRVIVGDLTRRTVADLIDLRFNRSGTFPAESVLVLDEPDSTDSW